MAGFGALFAVIGGTISFTVGVGLSAAVTITATRATLLQGSSIFSAEFSSLSATIDLDAGAAEFILTAAQLDASIADVASLSLQNVELYLGNAPNTPTFSAATAVATSPLLGDIALTLTDLQIARDGSVPAETCDSFVVLSQEGTSDILTGIMPPLSKAGRYRFCADAAAENHYPAARAFAQRGGPVDCVRVLAMDFRQLRRQATANQ